MPGAHETSKPKNGHFRTANGIDTSPRKAKLTRTVCFLGLIFNKEEFFTMSRQDTIVWVQTRLHAHNFNPGVVDGIWGRNTANALVAFQGANGLPQNGQPNQATLNALAQNPENSSAAKAKPPSRDLLDHFPWMALALSKKGLHEKQNNVDLRKFLKSDGKTLGDPAQLPWCGDFVETCIAVTLPTEPLPTNPYLARNWQKFGQGVTPCFGSVLVFWRGSISGTKGHVGFYYSEDATHFHVLGGNQSNRVSVSSIARNRLLSAQMPRVGGPYPRQKVTSEEEFLITVNEF